MGWCKIKKDIEEAKNCVVSGSFCGWGDIFIPYFTHVIYINAPTNLRIERLNRSAKSYTYIKKDFKLKSIRAG